MARITAKQRTALELLRRSPHPGVPTTSGSAMLDGQPWIHWRTAYALHDRGLVRIEPYGEEDAEIFLTVTACPAAHDSEEDSR